MGVCCSVVEAFVRAMFDAGHDLALRRTVGAELIGDHDAGRTALPFQKLAHQPLCSPGIAATLDQNIEDESILIHGAPEPVFLPPMVMTTSSRYHVSPSRPADRLRISLATCLPNFSAHNLTVW